MKTNAIVLSTSPFKFNDSQGNNVSGITFFYLLTESLLPVPADETGRKGTDPQQGRLSFDFVKEFTQVPGIYEVDFAMKTSAKNISGAMTIQGVRYKAPISKAMEALEPGEIPV